MSERHTGEEIPRHVDGLHFLLSQDSANLLHATVVEVIVREDQSLQIQALFQDIDDLGQVFLLQVSIVQIYVLLGVPRGKVFAYYFAFRLLLGNLLPQVF